MYSTHLSGSIFGEYLLNGKSNPTRSSMNEKPGAISGNQIVQNNSVYEEEQQLPPNIDRGRNTLGNSDPEEEVVVLSPNSLMNKYPIICQICKKRFQREQNLELHKRSHKLPFNLKKNSQTNYKKKVYLCPITTCLRHRPSRALGDISGMKKHFSRKHCPKTFKCPKCSKPYAVRADMRAHMNNCGTNDYKCDCGSLFRRNDSFNKHKKSCEVVLGAGSARASTSHPQLVTSSEDNSRNETMNHYYLGNMSPPPGFSPSPPMLQLNIPPPQGSPSIDNLCNQVKSSAQGHIYTPLNYGANTIGKSAPFPPFSSSDTSINYTFSGEPRQNLSINNPSFNGHAFPTEFLAPQIEGERNDNSTMNQANQQSYKLLQMNNMMDGSSTVGPMSQLQMAGGGIDHCYEPPNFLSFSALQGTSMSDGYRVAFGGGMNGYGAGSGWVPWMTYLGNQQQQHYVNGHQLHDIGCGPSTSTSRISSAASQGRNSQE